MTPLERHSIQRGGPIQLGGPNASRRLAQNAPRFEPLVQRHGPARVPQPESLFATLVEAICHQQLSMSAGRAIYARLQDAYPKGLTPRSIHNGPQERLRKAGLSEPKASYVARIAERLQEHPLSPRLDHLDDATTQDALTDLPGVGAWTARIAMIFALHRPDVLPCTDHGVLDGARRLLQAPDLTSEHLAEHAKKWAPYRSLAAWYVWAERDRWLREEGKRTR